MQLLLQTHTVNMFFYKHKDKSTYEILCGHHEYGKQFRKRQDESRKRKPAQQNIASSYLHIRCKVKANFEIQRQKKLWYGFSGRFILFSSIEIKDMLFSETLIDN